jgi:hypothetical protein
MSYGRRVLACAGTLVALVACAPSRTRGGARAPAPAATPFGSIQGRPDGHRWLEGDTARARANGASDSQVVAVGAGAAGDRIDGMLSVPVKDCVLLLARASESVQDVDLFAYADDGKLLGADQAPDKTPTLLVCPPHPTHIYLVARIAAGEGLVAIGAQRVPVQDAARVGQALHARGRREEARGQIQAWANLDSDLQRHRRLIGSTWQDVRRVAVPLEPSLPTHVSAMVDAHRCLDVLVVPSDEVSHLEVSVVDTRGHIIGHAASRGRARSIVVCSPAHTPVTISIRPHAGRGLAAILLSRSAAGAETDLDLQPATVDLAPLGDLAEVEQKTDARLDRDGYRNAKVVGRGALSAERRLSVALEVPRGCSRLDVLAGRPARGVRAWLWDPQGALIAEASGGGAATLFCCGPGGRARLDLQAGTRAGPFAVELRAEEDTPRVLDDHPLAAGRLLGHMLGHGIIKAGSDISSSKLVTLTSTHLQSVDVLVPVRRCVDLTLALSEGASGAEIRLVDSSTGKEIAYSRGPFASAARACALTHGTTLHVRAELRVAAGSSQALFATRMLASRP